jgi:hypothetical protein
MAQHDETISQSRVLSLQEDITKLDTDAKQFRENKEFKKAQDWASFLKARKEECRYVKSLLLKMGEARNQAKLILDLADSLHD